MSNEADAEIVKVPADFHDPALRGDMEAVLSSIFDRRPWPNTRSGNEWVRIKAGSELKRRR